MMDATGEGLEEDTTGRRMMSCSNSIAAGLAGTGT